MIPGAVASYTPPQEVDVPRFTQVCSTGCALAAALILLVAPLASRFASEDRVAGLEAGARTRAKGRRSGLVLPHVIQSTGSMFSVFLTDGPVRDFDRPVSGRSESSLNRLFLPFTALVALLAMPCSCSTACETR